MSGLSNKILRFSFTILLHYFLNFFENNATNLFGLIINLLSVFYVLKNNCIIFFCLDINNYYCYMIKIKNMI